MFGRYHCAHHAVKIQNHTRGEPIKKETEKKGIENQRVRNAQPERMRRERAAHAPCLRVFVAVVVV